MNPKIKLILYNAFKNPLTKSIILSKNQRAANRFLEEIEKVAAENEFCKRRVVDVVWLNLNNFSRIYSLAAEPSYKLCGVRANFCYLNGITDEKVIQEIARPFLTTINNPVEQQKITEAENKLIAAGIFSEADRTKFFENQLINLNEIN